MTIIHKGGSEW